MEKRYSSFAEIDERLRILRLQREIDKESIKLHMNRAKTSLYPVRLAGGFTGLLQKIVLKFAVKKLSYFSNRLRTFRKEKQSSRAS